MIGLGILTAISGIAVVVGPKRICAARRSAITAGVSPLWLLIPWFLTIVTSPLLLFVPGAERVVELIPSTMSGRAWVGLQLSLFAVQLAFSAWVVYRHRRWLRLVLPFAVILLFWAVPILAAAAAVAIGPMVKS